MGGRSSLGAMVAIFVALVSPMTREPSVAREIRAATPVEVTLALQSNGVELRIARERLALTFTL